MIKRFAAALMLLAVLAVGVAACGSDDSTSSTSDTPPEPVAAIDSLDGVATTVALDKGFVDALGQLGLTPGTVGDASLKGTDISFPITGGNVEYYDPAQSYRPYVQGEINHDGSGLSLTAGKTTVELTDFNIDPGKSTLTGTVTANGEVAAKDALLFDLDGSTLKPLSVDENAGTATLEGTQVLLSQDAADLLNQTFKTDALAGGFLIGISSIEVSPVG